MKKQIKQFKKLSKTAQKILIALLYAWCDTNLGKQVIKESNTTKEKIVPDLIHLIELGTIKLCYDKLGKYWIEPIKIK